MRGTTAMAVTPLANAPVRPFARGTVSRWPSFVSIESRVGSSARASTIAPGPCANAMARSFATLGYVFVSVQPAVSITCTPPAGSSR